MVYTYTQRQNISGVKKLVNQKEALEYQNLPEIKTQL